MVKAADGCKADWTSASRHEPRRSEATMRCRRINRITAQEAAEGITYAANELNHNTLASALMEKTSRTAAEIHA